MNETDQMLAIAKIDGYTNIRYDWINGSDPIKDWMHDEGRGIPNYLYDLNAMHRVEKILSTEQNLRYRERLQDMFSFSIHTPSLAIFATAKQRTEAFLKTLNLWTMKT